MFHHTKTNGDIGLLRVIENLIIKGYEISLPIAEYLPYDLIAVKGDKFLRINAKYRTLNKNGVIEITFKAVSDRKNTIVDKTAVDFWAIFNPEHNEVYYIRLSDFKTNTINLRFTESKNNQKVGLRFARDFLDITI